MSESTPYWMYRRRFKTPQQAYEERRERRRRQMGHPTLPVTVEAIADSEFLYEIYKKAKQGGQAPGIDKVTYGQLSNSEVGELMRVAAPVLLKGEYKAQPTRRVSIPKRGKPGHRELNLGVILDRVIAKALQARMKHYWEPTFLECSYGFREGRSPWKMLAALEAQMVTEQRWVLVTSDLKSAFDEVRLDDVMEVHKKLLDARPIPQEKKEKAKKQQEKLLRLIESVVRGHDASREKGINQGNPYSPTCLNAVLHYGLDEPVRDMIESPLSWLRYGDNLAYPALSVSEGRSVLRKVRQQIKPLGLILHESNVSDLAKGMVAEFLGFTLQKQGDQVVYDLGKKAMLHLAQNLGNSHDSQDPTGSARKSLLGWVESAGPAFQNGVSDIPKVLRLAANQGFRELASPLEIKQHWEDAWGRWLVLREREYRRRQGTHLLLTAPPSLPPVSPE